MCVYRYMFDDLSYEQAEELLSQHGKAGTYLISHFHETDTYSLSVMLRSAHACRPACGSC